MVGHFCVAYRSITDHGESRIRKVSLLHLLLRMVGAKEPFAVVHKLLNLTHRRDSKEHVPSLVESGGSRRSALYATCRLAFAAAYTCHAAPCAGCVAKDNPGAASTRHGARDSGAIHARYPGPPAQGSEEAGAAAYWTQTDPSSGERASSDSANSMNLLQKNGGADETRTRDLLRDRQAF